MLRFAWWTIGAFNVLLLVYFVILNIFYLTNTILAFGALKRQSRKLKVFHIDDMVSAGGALPVSVLIPAYNEEKTCVASVRATLGLTYPDTQIILVNDGSKDGTLDTLTQTFALQPAARMSTAGLPTARVRGIYHSRHHANLWVIDKENGGKADALNAGLNHCQTPLFCAIDSDTILERDSLTRLTRPFLEDTTTIASGGIVRIANGCTVQSGFVTEVRLPRNWLAKFQVLEYLRAFLAGRMGWEAINATLIISGALGLFQRAVVVDAGGYATDSIGEDMELVVRLHRFCHDRGLRYHIAYVPDPVGWTEGPEDLRTLSNQRDRWQRGLIDTVSRHRSILFNPSYGKTGLVVFPYFYILEMLGPVIELCGYITFAFTLLFGETSTLFILTLTMVVVVLGISISIGAVVLEELSFRRYPRIRDLLQLLGLAVIENIGYRQLVTYWRFRGVMSSLLGKKSWGQMKRKGQVAT